MEVKAAGATIWVDGYDANSKTLKLTIHGTEPPCFNGLFQAIQGDIIGIANRDDVNVLKMARYGDIFDETAYIGEATKKV